MQPRLLPARSAARLAAVLLGLGAAPLALPLSAQPALRGALTPDIESGVEGSSSPSKLGEIRPRNGAAPSAGAQRAPASDATAAPMLDVAAACTDSTRPITPLIDLGSDTTPLIRAGQTDEFSPVTPIGFDFVFQGARQDCFSVDAFGLLRFGAASIPTKADSQRARSSHGKVHCKLLGTAPNRTLIVEWLSLPALASAANAPASATCQLRLCETTGAIEFAAARPSERQLSATPDAPRPAPSGTPSPRRPSSP